jgi:GntR family transcriptional repressor for pyruvate dehydrogenase complex
VAASRQLTAGERSMINEALRAVREAKDPADHRQADSRLHLAIASLTKSPALVDAVRRVQADLHDMLVTIPVLAVNIEHSNAQHDAIVEAIIAGDPIRARRVMESHCDDTAALLRGLLA